MKIKSADDNISRGFDTLDCNYQYVGFKVAETLVRKGIRPSYYLVPVIVICLMGG